MKTIWSKPQQATRRPTGTIKRFLLVGSSAILAFVLAAVSLSNLISAEADVVEQFMHLHGLAVPPWAPDSIFVSTHQGLIRIDGDGNWRYVSEVPHDFMGFQVNPTEEGVLYSSGHPAPGSKLRNPLGFMVSRDGGVTWEVKALEGQVDFHVLAVQPTDGKVIYGFAHDLYRSFDGGETWEQLPSGRLRELGGVFSLSVHPGDADIVLAGTQQGLWRSGDGGMLWENIIPNVPVTAVV